MERVRIIKLCDYRKLSVPQKLLEVELPGEVVEQKMAQAAKRFLKIIHTNGPVEPGDIVIADLKSGDLRWQKEKQHINVGLGFFEPAIEAALPGMTVGASKTVAAPGMCASAAPGQQVLMSGQPLKAAEQMPATAAESPAPEQVPVTIFVNDICRRVIPPLTDENIPALEIEGVETVEQYRAYVCHQALEQAKMMKFNALIPYVIKQMAAQSEFDIPKEVVERKCGELLEEIRRITGAGEAPEEAFLIDFLAGQLHKKLETVEAARDALKEFALELVKEAVLAQQIASDQGKVFDKETYEAYVTDLAAQVGQPAESVKLNVPYEVYLERAPQMFLFGYLQDYFADKLTVKDKTR